MCFVRLPPSLQVHGSLERDKDQTDERQLHERSEQHGAAPLRRGKGKGQRQRAETRRWQTLDGAHGAVAQRPEGAARLAKSAETAGLDVCRTCVLPNLPVHACCASAACESKLRLMASDSLSILFTSSRDRLPLLSSSYFVNSASNAMSSAEAAGGGPPKFFSENPPAGATAALAAVSGG